MTVLPPRLNVIPHDNPLTERTGFDPTSAYVETCWLPIMGPTATFLYRRLGSWVIAQPEGCEVDTIDLGVSLGVGGGAEQELTPSEGHRPAGCVPRCVVAGREPGGETFAAGAL